MGVHLPPLEKRCQEPDTPTLTTPQADRENPTTRNLIRKLSDS